MLVDPRGWSHQRCLVLRPWIDSLSEDVEGGGELHSGRLSTVLVPIVVLGRQLSQTTPGCVTRHTRHASVTHCRPISGNIVEVTLVTSPKHVSNSPAKETYFPSLEYLL